MTYNWQQPDWGKFTYSIDKIEDLLFTFTEKAGHIKGLLKAIPKSSHEEAIIEILVSEALKTFEIENEFLSREDVMSSIRHNLGLYEPNHTIKDSRAKGIGQLMIEVRNTYDLSLDELTIKNWHRLLFEHQTMIKTGEWRVHKAPMQVVSGRLDQPTIHFEAPPSHKVPQMMKLFVDWFNDTSLLGKHPIKHAPIRSAMAHLYFESIHPFEDGNGRIGRVIADKALSQTSGYPLVLSLSAAIENNKKDYYNALKEAQKSNEITGWLLYFLQVIIDAQSTTEGLINFTLKKIQFFDRHRSALNKRQLKAVNRMFKEGPKGFKGGMTAKKYMRITQTSKATATRDLKYLEQIGALNVSGGGRSTHYTLNFDPSN